MDRNPLSKIYTLIRNLGVVKHKSRQEFLCSLLEGLIKSRSVLFSEIADKIDLDIKPESIERRIQGFFQKTSFDYLQLGKLLLGFVHHHRVILSIDRTEWDFGLVQVNILCAVVSIGKMAVPVYFEMLDNNSGNSSASDRISLFKSLVKLVGKDRVELLVMDREFVGHKWLSWLKAEGIPFCVRVPKHHTVLFSDGSRVHIGELLQDSGRFTAKQVVVDQVVVNISLSYDAKGELLYLIGTGEPRNLPRQYKKRWSIEVFFQALKGRGFNLEKSCLKSIEKYKKLFAVVCLAYTVCWATGIQDGRQNPVKQKNHGYPQYSVFRRGMNLLRKFYKNQVLEPIWLALELAEERIFEPPKIIG